VRTLVIDSATEACSVALFDGGAMMDGAFRMLGRGHAEQLVPMLAALPERGKAQRIAVDLGPGSFTGIRVGLAAARALAFAWGAELFGYTSASLLAAMAAAERPGEAVEVALTGGHGEWFVQPFAAAIGEPAAPLRSLDPAAAAQAATANLVVGSQAEALVAARGWGEARALWPDARRFLLLGPAALRRDPPPAYGRAPDARLPSAA
jgi:tRNA threonylcarbamoyladenosine biosynthesis protein TsaB